VRSSDEKVPREDNAFEPNIIYANEYAAMDKAISTVAKKASEVELTDDQLLLCKHLVRGYSLKLKKWRKLELTDSLEFCTNSLTETV
jgi:hypothetical protein